MNITDYMWGNLSDVFDFCQKHITNYINVAYKPWTPSNDLDSHAPNHHHSNYVHLYVIRYVWL